MQNKKSLTVVITAIAIVLIFVIIKSLNKDSFAQEAENALEKSVNQDQIITVDKLKEKFSKSGKISLIDLRTSDDFKLAHLENAINIPIQTILENQELEKIKSMGNDLILYSNSQTETGKAWTILTRMGFQNLYILDIDSEYIAKKNLGKDNVIRSSETLKYIFQPDTAARLE